MTDFKGDELSLNKLKNMFGGFKGNAECHDQMAQAKGYRRTQPHSQHINKRIK